MDFCVSLFQDEDLDFTLATDFEIGHFFRERIIPRAVLYFTGEALEDDESVRHRSLIISCRHFSPFSFFPFPFFLIGSYVQKSVCGLKIFGCLPQNIGVEIK